MNLKKYLLEIIVFSSGASVMIFEIIGSRILGPYLGTSIFVWTSIIGIILASLSLGYHLGGKLSDKNPHIKNLSIIFFLASILMLFTIVIKNNFLLFLVGMVSSIRINAVIASIILFSPVSVMLGMVSPYAVRLKIQDVEHSGSTVGNLYALSTLGSIFGTFLAGFWLIPSFGATNILIGLVIILLLLSIISFPRELLRSKIALSVLCVILIGGNTYQMYVRAQNGFVELDTAYSHVLIIDSQDENGKDIRTLKINNEFSSAIYLNSYDLVYGYTKFYDLAEYFTPKIENTLMIGGAAYSYPKYFLEKYKDAKIDVIEIDSELTEIAKKYFGLESNPRLTTYHEDGRTFLNRSNKKYDVIYGDAFSSVYTVPFQLTTQEAVKQMYNKLTDEGVLIVNVISSLQGDTSKFFHAQLKTYKSIFEHVEVFPVSSHEGSRVQNIILVAYRSDNRKPIILNNKELDWMLEKHYYIEETVDIPVLTDEYAPVDSYIDDIL